MIVHFTPFRWLVEDLLKNQTSVVFESDSTWRFFGGPPRNLGFSGQERLVEDFYLFPEVYRLLKASTPTWSRFFPLMSQLDNHLQYLCGLTLKICADLLTMKVSAAIQHTGSPHHPSTLIFHIACQVLNIRVIYLYPEPFSSRLLPVEFRFPPEGVIAASGPTPLKIEVSEANLDEDIRAYIALAEDGRKTKIFSDVVKQSTESIVSAAALALSIHLFWRFESIRAFAGFPSERYLSRVQTFDLSTILQPQRTRQITLIDEIRVMRVQSDAIKVLRRFVQEDSGAKSNQAKLVFYAHFQPESTTYPEQGMYWHDPLFAVRAIRESGWTGRIVFKEHPMNLKRNERFSFTRVGVARSPSFYQSLREFGCEFLNPVERFEESDGDIVATVAGSIAVERAVNGLPTLVLGAPWYSGLPGVIPWSKDGECLNAYKAARQGEVPIDEVKSFLSETLNSTTLDTPVKMLGRREKASPEIRSKFLAQIGRLEKKILDRLQA